MRTLHFLNHHWHRIATILKRVSPDCVGEEVAVYRCCICRKVLRGIPLCTIGCPESNDAYRVVTEVPV